MGWQTLLFLCLLLSAAGIVVLGVVGGIWWIVRVVRRKEQSRPARRLAAQTRTAIASATGGSVVKIEGRVRLRPETLVAPFSGRTCAYFALSIEQKQSQGRRHWWENAVTDRRGVDFVVEDETGRALVSVARSAIAAELVNDANASSGMFEKRTPTLEALVRRYKLDPQTVFGIDRAFRYHEGVLTEGERVAVSGTAHWELDPEGGPSARRLVITPPANAPLLLSDHPDAWQR